MIRMQYRLLIRRQAAAVFAMLVDFPQLPRWKSHVVEWTQLTAGPLAVGSAYRSVIKVLGLIRFTSAWKVTEVQPDRLLTLETTAGPLTCEVSYRLVDLGEDTALYYRAQGEPTSRLLSLGAPLVAPLIRGMLIADLLRLRNDLEQAKPTSLPM